jgi:hypothetical protein
MSKGWDPLRRRKSIVNAIASRYGVLLSPELLEQLLRGDEDPVELVGRSLEQMADHPLVLSEVKR